MPTGAGTHAAGPPLVVWVADYPISGTGEGAGGGQKEELLDPECLLQKEQYLQLTAKRKQLAEQYRSLNEEVAMARRERRRQMEPQAELRGTFPQPQSRPRRVDGFAASTCRGLGRPTSHQQACRAVRTQPLVVWPTWLHTSDGISACEKERSELMVQAREHDVLACEQRALNEEVAVAEREARTELALQRARAVAMLDEQEELQELADEAQSILKLRESLAQAKAEGRASPVKGVEPEVAEVLLERECAAVQRRAAGVGSSKRPTRLRPGATLGGPALDELEPAQVTPRIQRVDMVIQASASPSMRRAALRRDWRSHPDLSAEGASPTSLSSTPSTLPSRLSPLSMPTPTSLSSAFTVGALAGS